MTIIGRGDLSPPRRYHPGSRRRWPRRLLALVVLAALAAGGWYGWQRWRDDGNASLSTTPRACSTPTGASHALPTASAPPMQPVRVLNGTLRSGLAKSVAHALRSHHVPVGMIGNAAQFIRGDSTISYPAARVVEAQLVAAALVPQPRLVAGGAATHVQLELGTRYRRVATRAEFRAALAAFHLAASPTPSPTACPTP